MMELSLHSFLGKSSPTTTKIRGKIGKTNVVVLIDSGATHNFISPDIVSKAYLQVSETRQFTIIMGTSINVTGAGMCKGVLLQIIRIKADFIVLEPGGVDVVLGV